MLKAVECGLDNVPNVQSIKNVRMAQAGIILLKIIPLKITSCYSPCNDLFPLKLKLMLQSKKSHKRYVALRFNNAGDPKKGLRIKSRFSGSV